MIKHCTTCKDTGYISVKGTEHIGPDGNVDNDITRCTECKNIGIDEDEQQTTSTTSNNLFSL